MRTNLTAAAAAVLALALTTAGVAFAAKPYKNTVYKGSTDQNTGVRFKTSRDGNRVGSFDFGTAKIQCDTSPPGERNDIRLKFGGRLKVGKDGRFRGTLPNNVTNEGSITVRGRFTSRGRAQGAVTYSDRGCIGQNTITWTVKRPPPPVAPFKKSVFKGKSSQNGSVRFRTSRDGKRVGSLDFGDAQVLCPDASGRTPRRLSAPGTLTVKNGRFKGILPPTTSDSAISVNGRFTSRGRATGTVAYLDRGCDARDDPLTFSATRRK